MTGRYRKAGLFLPGQTGSLSWSSFPLPTPMISCFLFPTQILGHPQLVCPQGEIQWDEFMFKVKVLETYLQTRKEEREMAPESTASPCSLHPDLSHFSQRALL